MKKVVGLFFLLVLICSTSAYGQNNFEVDRITGGNGDDLRITFIGHGSLQIVYNSQNIYIDPVGNYADFKEFPAADLILITHEHFDHLDSTAVEQLSRDKTAVFVNSAGADKIKAGLVMKNGDRAEAGGIVIEAVPAYNLVHRRPDGEPYHPAGSGNGYVLSLGQTRIYIAGDTENIPEMANLAAIDIAFLPMNLPYTMTPEMTAAAARSFQPKILYPYHYGDTDPQKLVELLKNDTKTEVRIRSMR